MRTTRIRIAVAAGATTALALGLTAFANADSGSSNQADRGPAATATVAAHTPAGGAQQASGTVVAHDADSAQQVSLASAKTSAKKTATPKATSVRASAKKSATSVRQCSGDELSYDVLHRFPKQQGEHLLVTAQNADSKPCWVTSYPSVMLGDTVNVLPHSKKDAPGGATRITLRPGAKVYSAVNLFVDSKKTRTSTELSLALRDQTGDTGPASELNAFTSKGAVSKFTWSSADVTNWNTAKPYDF